MVAKCATVLLLGLVATTGAGVVHYASPGNGPNAFCDCGTWDANTGE